MFMEPWLTYGGKVTGGSIRLVGPYDHHLVAVGKIESATNVYMVVEAY